MLQLFAACAPGLEAVLLGEVQALGLEARALGGGVELRGTLMDAMRLNLWLRTASRVLVRIGEVKATAFPELVRKAQELRWEEIVAGPVALRVTCHKSRLYHSAAVAERLHAALEARLGRRVQRVQAVAEDAPGAQLIVARFDRDVCTVSADSSGALLHRRGWRGPHAKAPLRETLAAALLLSAGYAGDVPLCDPLCGSGTIAIEAALIAMRRAPGLRREFSFMRWPAFDAAGWAEMKAAARQRERPLQIRIEASDRDAGAVAAARENAAGAEIEIDLSQRALAQLPPADGAGLIACNPPYGKRLAADAQRVFRELGEAARRRPGWRLAAVAADVRAAQAAGLAWQRLLRTQNGGISVEFIKAAGRGVGGA